MLKRQKPEGQKPNDDNYDHTPPGKVKNDINASFLANREENEDLFYKLYFSGKNGKKSLTKAITNLEKETPKRLISDSLNLLSMPKEMENS